MKTVILWQVPLILATSIIAGWLNGWMAAASAGFGGSIALANVLLMAWRLRSAGTAADSTPVSFYLGAVERFAFTLSAFAFGMGYLELPPLPMLFAFGLAQIAYVVAQREAMPGADRSRLPQHTS